MNNVIEIQIGHVLSLLALKHKGLPCLEAMFFDRDPRVGYEKSIRQFICGEKIKEGFGYVVIVRDIFSMPEENKTIDGRRRVIVSVDILSILGRKKFGRYKKPTTQQRNHLKEETHGEEEVQEPGEKQSRGKTDFSISRSNGREFVATAAQAP